MHNAAGSHACAALMNVHAPRFPRIDTECDNGVGNLTVLKDMGTALDKHQVRYSQQTLMPFLSFTCNGTLTTLTFAASASGLGTLFPELQVWRPGFTNGSGPYTKVFSNNQRQPRGI